MDIHRLLAAKRAQISRLQAQVQVLEELATEIGVGRRRGRPRTRGNGRGQGGVRAAHGAGVRAGRGANQRKLLSVLTDTPQRARDISPAVGLTQQNTTQVLKALIGKGMAERTGRGQYKAGATPGGGATDSSKPRAGADKTSRRRPAQRRGRTRAKK